MTPHFAWSFRIVNRILLLKRKFDAVFFVFTKSKTILVVFKYLIITEAIVEKKQFKTKQQHQEILATHLKHCVRLLDYFHHI